MVIFLLWSAEERIGVKDLFHDRDNSISPPRSIDTSMANGDRQPRRRHDSFKAKLPMLPQSKGTKMVRVTKTNISGSDDLFC